MKITFDWIGNANKRRNTVVNQPNGFAEGHFWRWMQCRRQLIVGLCKPLANIKSSSNDVNNIASFCYLIILIVMQCNYICAMRICFYLCLRGGYLLGPKESRFMSISIRLALHSNAIVHFEIMTKSRFFIVLFSIALRDLFKNTNVNTKQ